MDTVKTLFRSVQFYESLLRRNSGYNIPCLWEWQFSSKCLHEAANSAPVTLNLLFLRLGQVDPWLYITVTPATAPITSPCSLPLSCRRPFIEYEPQQGKTDPLSGVAV